MNIGSLTLLNRAVLHTSSSSAALRPLLHFPSYYFARQIAKPNTSRPDKQKSKQEYTQDSQQVRQAEKPPAAHDWREPFEKREQSKRDKSGSENRGSYQKDKKYEKREDKRPDSNFRQEGEIREKKKQWVQKERSEKKEEGR